MVDLRMFAPLALVTVLLAGCAGVSGVAYDKESAAVERIALLTPAFPAGPSAYDTARVQNTAGATGGFIGSLIGAAIDAESEAARNLSSAR